ncbi:DUF6314 family protein [Streptomyces sp. NPDC001307]
MTSGRHVAEHPCAADLHRGQFTVQWRARGPAKDLVLSTDYVRDG